MIFKRTVAKLRAQDWMAISIELVIVMVGVLLALWAQQWAQERSAKALAEADRRAIQEEALGHYSFAVEYRTVYPCIHAQLETLRDRLEHSGSVLDTSPIFHEDASDASGIVFDFVLRRPVKNYPNDAWQRALSDGAVELFDPGFRDTMTNYYATLGEVSRINAANEDDFNALNVLSRPQPLDPMVRFAIAERIAQVSARLQWVDQINGQLIELMSKAGLTTNSARARSETERYGTFFFCKKHGLPLRSFEEAERAVPN